MFGVWLWALLSISSVFAEGDRLIGDLNGDGQVNFTDFLLLSQNFGKTGGAVFDPSETSIDTVFITKYDTIGKNRRLSNIQYKLKEWDDFEDNYYFLPKWNRSKATFVLTKLRDVFSEPFAFASESNIIVWKDNYSSPNARSRLFHKRSPNGEFRIYLTNGDFLKFVYDFMHEYAHVLGEHWKIQQSRNTWLEEAMAHTACLYMFEILSERLSDSSIHSEWNHEFWDPDRNEFRVTKYAELLLVASEQFIYSGVPKNTDPSFTEWFKFQHANLEANPTDYSSLSHIARNLVDIFHNNPEAWNILRYMAPYGPHHFEADQDFLFYMAGWWYRTPPQWRKYVAEVGHKFGRLSNR